MRVGWLDLTCKKMMILCYLYLKIIALMNGVNCQLDIITDDTPLAERGPCISDPCLHNGLCTITRSGFICTCVDGYIGVMCERRSDDCPSDNSLECVFGRCKLDMNGDPRCLCNDGYQGTTCSSQTEGCNSKPCLNGGSCVDQGYSYKCLCPANISGTHCQIIQSSIHECLSLCKEKEFGGKCWHETRENVSVSWGYGDLMCNSKQTCFDMPPSNENQQEYMEVQLRPIDMQYTDSLVFLTDREYNLHNNQFIPHILPMETNSQTAFISCNLSNGQPLTNDPTVSQLNVNSSLLKVGTQYFLADINALYRCVFGLRLNVTVKGKDCADDGDSTVRCNGHGRCFSNFHKKSYECTCCEGYIGKYCQHEDPCLIKSCKNNGTCNIIDYGGGILKHYCTCPYGYHGNECDEVVNHCSSNKCEHDGVCHPELFSYRCECQLGFSGRHCETNDDECANIMCQHGATCVNTLHSFRCECPEGYKGTLCEVDIDECQMQPCVDGTCVDLLNNYTCACKAGRSGRNCERVLTACSTQECTNGMCVKEKKEFSCSCGIGYTGMLCEIKLDLCQYPKFCLMSNAQRCVDQEHNVSCICLDGWTGNNCGVNINDCLDNKCFHNGSCVDKLNGYECKCMAGYTGELCEDIKFKSTADIEVEFLVDNCQKLDNVQGVQFLQDNIFKILAKSCKCDLSTYSIQRKASRISCIEEKAGVFMTDLKLEDVKYLKDIVCSMVSTFRTESKLNLSHGVSLVSIIDNQNLCSSLTELTVSIDDTYLKTGVLAGVVVGILIVILSLVMVSIKVRNIRRKVGVSQTLDKYVFSFDNTTFKKENNLEDVTSDETSFTSSDPHDLPKWSEGSTRSRNLYERSNRNSQSRKSCNINGQTEPPAKS